MGQKNVVMDWDLPTFEEKVLALVPDAAKALERQARCQLYQEIYQLCANVDADLEAGYHLYDNQGRVLLRLDEWVRAVEEGRWL